MLFGGLLPVPFAFRKRFENSLRYRILLWVSIVYLSLQGSLYFYIYGFLRYENRDWLHALFLPIILGLALPVVMAIIWLFTRRNSN